MEIIKKIYCRAYQMGLRAALPILPYRNPAIVKSIKKLPKVLEREGKSHPLVVTDGFLYKNGFVKPLISALKDAGMQVDIFHDTEVNPTTDNVEEAKKVYERKGCDCLIGFGGGSAIDCAKACGARIARPDKTLDKMEGILKVVKKTPLMTAIPTTAGTGSETTLAAVVVNSKTRHKYAINDFPLIPDIAVHDPEVTRTLPPKLTAETGMDALTHAVEAYIGRSTSKQTRKEALRAVNIIFKNIERAYANGNDMKARANMLKAAYLAGDAFSKSYVGYVHAVAHSLGGEYNIGHGLANAVILPYVLEEYGSAVDKKLHRLAVAAGVACMSDSYREGAKKFIKAVRTLNRNMSIPDKLSGIKQKDIPRLAAIAEKEANPLYPVPVIWDASRLEKIYYAVMQ